MFRSMGARLEGFEGRRLEKLKETKKENERLEAKNRLIYVLNSLQVELIKDHLNGIDRNDCWKAIKNLCEKIQGLEVVNVELTTKLTIGIADDGWKLITTDNGEFLRQMTIIDGEIIPVIMKEKFDPDKRIKKLWPDF